MTLLLYSTLGCHLCELAEELIRTTVEQGVLTLTIVEIANSNDLLDRYGLTIPVLQARTGAELSWPFDRPALVTWLAENV